MRCTHPTPNWRDELTFWGWSSARRTGHLFNPEGFENVFGECILDFGMSRHWLRYLCGGIVIPIVPLAVAQEDATHPVKALDQVGPFHWITNSPTCRTQGMAPLSSSCRMSLRLSSSSWSVSPCVR